MPTHNNFLRTLKQGEHVLNCKLFVIKNFIKNSGMHLMKSGYNSIYIYIYTFSGPDSGFFKLYICNYDLTPAILKNTC